MNGGCWAEGFKSWIGSRTNWHGFRISSSTVWQSGSRNRENGWLALFRVGNWQNRCGRKSRGLEIWRFRKFTVLTSQRDLHSVLGGTVGRRPLVALCPWLVQVCDNVPQCGSYFVSEAGLLLCSFKRETFTLVLIHVSYLLFSVRN